MFSNKKLAILVVLVMIAPVVLAACGGTPETIVETVVETVVVEQTKIVEQEGETITVVETVEVEVTAPPPPEEEAPPEEAEGEVGPYRIALFEDPVTTNYWNYLGPGSSVWTSYIVDGQAPTLFQLSDVTFQVVPYLATELPEPVDNGDGTWTVTIPMAQDAVWSDGESITASDFLFTFNACKDLQLTQNWPNYCKPNQLEAAVETPDDYTVQITFLNQEPSLGNWQNGIALHPIMPEHFWADAAAEAYAFVEGVEEPDVDHPADCEAEDLSDEDAAPASSGHLWTRRTPTPAAPCTRPMRPARRRAAAM
jgi:ABC-type transport system substrate-binding protein